jgi:hypothetical protein
MTMATDPANAAFLTADQVSISWTAGTLRAQLLAFIDGVSPSFQDARPNDRPVGNWLVLLSAAAEFMNVPNGQLPLESFNLVVQNVFGICQTCWGLLSQSLITNDQADAFTDAWNAAWGTP